MEKRNDDIFSLKNYIPTLAGFISVISFIIFTKVSPLYEIVNLFTPLLIGFLLFESVLLIMAASVYYKSYQEFEEVKYKLSLNLFFFSLEIIGSKLYGAFKIKKYPFISILEYKYHYYLYVYLADNSMNKYQNIKTIVESYLLIEKYKLWKKVVIFKVNVKYNKENEDLDYKIILVNSIETIGEEIKTKKLL